MRLGTAVAVLVLIASLLFCGCATIQIDARGLERDVALTVDPNRNVAVVGHFKETSQARFAFFDLLTIREPKIRYIILREMNAAGGDAIENLRIQGQMTFVDGLIPALIGTAGALIWPPYGVSLGSMMGFRTYTFEADIVKYLDEGAPNAEAPSAPVGSDTRVRE